MKIRAEVTVKAPLDMVFDAFTDLDSCELGIYRKASFLRCENSSTNWLLVFEHHKEDDGK